MNKENNSSTVLNPPPVNSLYYTIQILLYLENYESAYFTPIFVIIGAFNNIIIIFVMHLSKFMKSELSKTVRIYYLMIAYADLSVLIWVHFGEFLGILNSNLLYINEIKY